MTKRCLDEGIIQAYLDGELSRESAAEAGAHLSSCDECAALLADAEQETAFFAASFAPDAGVAVPTEALRARLSAAVAQLEAAPEREAGRARGWSLGALLAPLSGLLSLTPQRAAAFASVLVVVASALVFYSVRRQPTPVDVPGVVARVEPPAAPPAAVSPTAEPKEVESDVHAPDANSTGPKPSRAEKAPAKRRAVADRRPAPPALAETASTTPKAEVLVPGEKNYQEAIASLEKVVKTGGDTVLSPKARIEYERNIAVIDRAIEETRRVALRNPKDSDAVSFLMSAYQSKVELLSAVADQTQVAAIGR
jgi:Putative zinc-finger